jgi:outer membrane murein-binding lipoprotein Lpp
MRKWLLVPGIAVIFVALFLSGCSSGVPADYEQVKSDLAATKSSLAAVQNQLATVQSQLATAQTTITGLGPQVAGLSEISAYNIWYDQYYGVDNYLFKDAATFQKELGALITATGDAATQAAWTKYLATRKSLDDIVTSLPADSTTWTNDQHSQWLNAYNASWADFGDVGTALYNATNFSVSQIKIFDLETQVAGLSAISAYNIWYDQYYNYGTDKQYYTFANTLSFDTRLGNLITTTGDNATIAAWNTYLAADKALSDVLSNLPKDSKTWTQDQVNQWSNASKPRIKALGDVGTALFNVISGNTTSTQ